MDDQLNWFEDFNKSQQIEKLKINPIAYFCAEFALSSGMPIYAGGLGVLAGDFLREASDRNFPLVGIGLYYNDGYQTLHHLDTKGFIEAPHTHTLPENYGLTLVVDENQKPITVSIAIDDHSVKVKAWEWKVGKIPVYLLDTDLDENSPIDRKITDHLYVTDKETRLKQEIILGIAGHRFLETLKITPSLYHMNEGHSAMLALEIVRNEMKRNNINFEEAIEKAKEKIVFTNHTLVPSGNETFSSVLVSKTLSKYAGEIGASTVDLMKYGKIKNKEEFSMTMFSLCFAGKTNAVSKLHAIKAKDIWPENQMIPITNGIHLPSWNSIASEDTLWQTHTENKKLLLGRINLEKEKVWGENDLLIGWARRLVEYKRPFALLENIDALKKIINNSKVKVRFVFSGTLHPSDATGLEMFDQFRKVIDEELSDNAVFLSGYNMELAKLLVSGCDIWANTPIVGFEACGTSSMKASLNGTLPISTRDGWMDEINFWEIGWELSNDFVNKSFLETLESKIIPSFTAIDDNGNPLEWQKHMRNARNLVKNNYSTTRMLKDYIEALYLPLLT